MKNTFKIALVALVGAFGYTANAQDTGVTVKGGVNFNTMSMSYDGKDAKGLESKVGFHIGAAYEVPVADIVFVEAGVLFDTRGLKQIETTVDNSFYSRKEETTLNLYSLNIPVVAKVKIPVSVVNVFLQVGPYANIFLSGKYKTESSATIKSTNETQSKSESNDVKFGTYTEDGVEEKGINRFDFGLNFGGGVEIQKFVVSLGYDLGLRNLDQEDKATTKASAFKIGVGYKF